MRPLCLATALFAANALAWGCTGGQSGTETPVPTAGQGGTSAGSGAGTGTGANSPVAHMDAAGKGGVIGGSGGSAGTQAGSGGDKAMGGRNPDTAAVPDFPFGATSASACACVLSGRGALLRGELLAIDGCSVRARIDEVLATPPGLSLELAAGDELTARRAKGSCSAVPELAPGAAVLLIYAPGAAAGSGEALIASWGDVLVFGSNMRGEPITLGRDAQSALLDSRSCSTAFASQTSTAAIIAEPCTEATTSR